MFYNPLAFREQHAKVNGLAIHFLEWGDRNTEAILLLHSLSGICRDWDLFAAGLADRYRLIAVDMRGFGDSDRDPAGHYDPEDFAADAVGLADQIGLRRFSVIGHSLGGRAALLLAHHHPSRVARLVLVDVGPYADPGGLLELRKRVADTPTVFSSFEEAFAKLRPHFTRTKEAEFRKWLAYYVRSTSTGFEVKRDPLFNQRFAKALAGQAKSAQPDLWDLWAQLACPILVLRGAESEMLTREIVERMLTTNRGASCVEIEGAGHNVPADNPAALLFAVKRFLPDSLVEPSQLQR